MNQDALQLSELGTYFGRLLSSAFSILGLVVFISILIGGYRILLAGGDTKAVQSGKGIILGAVSALAFAILSWLALAFIQEVTGAKVTEFNLMF